MTGDIVIRAEGLGKKYVIGHNAERERYVALRDVIARQARNFGRSAVDLIRGRPMLIGDEVEEFWALKDINFEVRRGEVLGIIGRNGAGKSTLLKILSRITEPTEGRVTIAGRVASLLEVGTGFHPELTGRENIFLNGAILGMSRREIRAKFDEIVAFAEIDKFLDTPVKRYSSGMYVRLAFAVAAHLEPEILIIDEVLAVGDVQFQKKCLGKMSDVARSGRTILFVSHNTAALAELCDRCAVLASGRLVTEGKSRQAIQQYIALSRSKSSSHYCDDRQTLNQPATLVEAELLDSNMEVTSDIGFRDDFSVRMRWTFSVNSPDASISLRFYDQIGRFMTAVNCIGLDLNATAGSALSLVCSIENRFTPGPYFITIGCYVRPHTTLSEAEDCLTFTVSEVGGDETFAIMHDPLFSGKASWEKLSIPPEYSTRAG